MVTANAFSVGDFVEAMNEAKRIIAKQADEIERLREALQHMVRWHDQLSASDIAKAYAALQQKDSEK